MLVLAGCAQSFCLVPMSAVLLRHSEESYRGRVMGIRMFSIYGLPLGLLIAGPLIASLGFAMMATVYASVGIGCTLLIALRWRAVLWHRDAAANAR
jgi:hypothetical protein